MSFKIGTFNIQSGIDRLHFLKTSEKKINLTAIADAIQKIDLDICGLNEVRNREAVAGGCNQAKVIAEQLGYHFFFAKAINHRGGEYGNALVSRFPILSTKCVPIHLPIEKRITDGKYYEDRVLLVAEILIESKVLTVIATHFGLNDDEIELAIKAVRELIKECKTPLILMGDFNFQSTDTHYPKLCEILTDTAAQLHRIENTFTSDDPKIRIDYVFTNNQVKILSNCVPDIVASDHKPYMVVAEI